MRPVLIALDIDGVLESSKWRRTRPRWIPSAEYTWDVEARHKLDPEPIHVLSGLYAWLGMTRRVDFVLTSSWRLHRGGTGRVERFLALHGFNMTFAGATPYRFDYTTGLTDSDRAQNRVRGLQIQEWIDTNPEYVDHILVIIDDSDDMNHLLHRLIRTDGRVGFTETDAKRVIALIEAT